MQKGSLSLLMMSQALKALAVGLSAGLARRSAAAALADSRACGQAAAGQDRTTHVIQPLDMPAANLRLSERRLSPVRQFAVMRRARRP